MWRPGGLRKQVAYRKSLPSQSSPQWKQVAVRSGQGAGAAPAGAALNSAEAAPGMESCSWAGGPRGQTPDALSPSAAPRSPLPALLSLPPGCRSPVSGYRGGRKAIENKMCEGQNVQQKQLVDVSSKLITSLLFHKLRKQL